MKGIKSLASTESKPAIRVHNFVVWHGMRLALTGVVGRHCRGIRAHSSSLPAFLFGVKFWDLALFILATLTLSAVAPPATRASKVDPIQALRAE